MKTRLFPLFFILIVFILVFIWGYTNYDIRYTDTPEDLPPELYVRNLDIFAIPAVFSAFAIMFIILIIIWMQTKDHKRRKTLVILSGIGIFFTFIGIFILILRNLN